MTRRNLRESAHYSQRQNSLLIHCSASSRQHKSSAKLQDQKKLDIKFPGIAAMFPEREAKFADFAQDLQKSQAENENFAAKFAEAGNSGVQTKSRSLRSQDEEKQIPRAKVARGMTVVGVGNGSMKSGACLQPSHCGL